MNLAPLLEGVRSFRRPPPHPQLEFQRPHRKVHVHLEDKAAEYPAGRVLWDADYDMGGTEVLKSAAKPLGGTHQEFHPLCPPKEGPAHWYELTVSRVGPKGFKPNPNRALEDFLGSQIVSTYRPDQDPELKLWGPNGRPDDPHEDNCSVM